MGLLDDAIRDHLELRRRHGADAGDVARQEREALGPVRRDAPGPADGGHADADADEEYDPRPEDLLAEDTEEEEPVYDEDLTGVPDLPAPEVTAEDAARRPPERADPRDVVPADEEPEGEDVLEETPEFLQETPEHDRLWFEQKPPRDFDF